MVLIQQQQGPQYNITIVVAECYLKQFNRNLPLKHITTCYIFVCCGFLNRNSHLKVCKLKKENEKIMAT